MRHNRDVQLPETKYVTVDNSQVAYQVVGDGPVDLVFNHGHCHIDVHWELEPKGRLLHEAGIVLEAHPL